MSKPSDQQMELAVAGMLRIGLILSAIIVIAGAMLLLRHPLGTVPNYSQFQAGDPSLRIVAEIFQGAIDLSPKSVIQFGLLVLIATPVARVVLCLVGFARQRSLIYVGVSTIVLLVLAYSFLKP